MRISNNKKRITHQEDRAVKMYVLNNRTYEETCQNWKGNSQFVARVHSQQLRITRQKLTLKNPALSKSIDMYGTLHKRFQNSIVNILSQCTWYRTAHAASYNKCLYTDKGPK